MNNYFSKLAANLSSKENNESNLTTLLKNLSDEKYAFENLPKFCREKIFSYICGGINFYWGSNIYYYNFII